MRPCDAARKLDCSPTLIAVSLRKYKDAEKAIRLAFCEPVMALLAQSSA